jgi:FkbM family methyltransferase
MKLLNIFFKYKVFRYLNYKFNVYLKPLNKLKKLNLTKNSIFIDIGGNRGFVSNFIDDYFGCNIEIYEPHTGCFKILKEKFQNNKKVKLYNFAVSNISNKSRLYLNTKSKNEFDIKFSASSSLEVGKFNNSCDNFIDINTIKIDDILNKHDFIDVIKVDIEQHEYKILPSIYSNLKKIGKVIIELHQDKTNHQINELYNFWNNKLKQEGLWGQKFFDWL